MCGIVGMIARKAQGFYQTDLEMFESLLLIDQLRGKDSTGVFGVDRNRHVGIMKLASHPSHLMACEDWRKMRQKSISDGRILIGHNRAATKGEINTDNAHPFHENNIVLVHNGTLRDDHKKKHADREVDSHALCAAFNEKGAENVLPTINGAFALIWWDIAKGTLFVCRNDERPLSMVITDDVILIASEPWMAQAVASRAHKKVQEVLEFEEGFLYELNSKMEFVSKKLISTSNISMAKVGTPTQACGTATTTECTTKPTGTEVVVLSPKDYPTYIDQFPNVQGPYARKEKVLVRFNEGQIVNDPKTDRQFIKFRGRTYEPGREIVDVLAFMPLLDGTQQLTRHLHAPMLMDVLQQSRSSCGWSLYGNNVQPASIIEVHNTTLAVREWKHVVDHCKCKKCEANLHDIEHEVTSVRTMPNGFYSVTCPDCILDAMEEGEVKNEFQQARTRALQVGEQVSNKPDPSTDGSIEAPSTPTLH